MSVSSPRKRTAQLLGAQLTLLLVTVSTLPACGVTTRDPAVARHAQATDFELPDQRGLRVALSQLTAGSCRAVLAGVRRR